MYNSEVFRIGIIIFLTSLIVGCKSPESATGVWYSGRLPQNITDGSQPAIGSGGVDHKVLSCKQLRSGDLLYRSQFNNPYKTLLNAFIATSLDGGARGTIWGVFLVQLPPGMITITFDTTKLDEMDRNKLLYETLPLSITHFVNECSVHLLGFKEGHEFEIIFPVAYHRFDSAFVIPKIAP